MMMKMKVKLVNRPKCFQHADRNAELLDWHSFSSTILLYGSSVFFFFSSCSNAYTQNRAHSTCVLVASVIIITSVINADTGSGEK